VAHSSRAEKPKKPRADFPLFPHASGRWAKKVRGKFCYFGKVADDPKGDAAINLWLDQKDDLLAGRTPRAGREGLTVRDLCNRFVAAKEDQADSGDIIRRTFVSYYNTAKLVVDSFGADRFVDDLASDDFEALRKAIVKRCNSNTLGNEIQRIRTLFKYGYDAGLIDAPIRFGPTFKRPAKRIIRAQRQRRGPRLFEARHLRRIIKAAPLPLKAMILLGANAGFGNGDCGRLPKSAIDLKSGWINFPRPKTAVERRVPLWPETIEAIKQALAERPEAKDAVHDNLVFITKYGQPWAKESSDSPISKEMRKLLDALKLYRDGLGFYALRHTFETIAGEGADQVAVNSIMGHADSSMSAAYRERISDRRLEAASDVVRKWLFRRESKTPWRETHSKEQPAD